MTYVLCRCKIHCTQYDVATNSYTGGEIVTRSTAAQHRADEDRSITHGVFSANIATSILEGGPLKPPQDPLHGSPLEKDSFNQEFLTLEHELGDRCIWAPSNRWLVFSLDPVPNEAFQPPSFQDDRLSTSAIHALNQSHPSNLAFIENENRLFDILTRLRAITGPEDLRERLMDTVEFGLQRMWSHKESEWNRQRCRAVAVERGCCIIDNGDYVFHHPKQADI